MTADQAPGVRAAEHDLAHVQDLITTHQATCDHPGCVTCYRLGRHKNRCEQQIALLTQPAEQGALF